MLLANSFRVVLVAHASARFHARHRFYLTPDHPEGIGAEQATGAEAPEPSEDPVPGPVAIGLLRGVCRLRVVEHPEPRGNEHDRDEAHLHAGAVRLTLIARPLCLYIGAWYRHGLAAQTIPQQPP